jgi:hypothetical protein
MRRQPAKDAREGKRLGREHEALLVFTGAGLSSLAAIHSSVTARLLSHPRHPSFLFALSSMDSAG